MILEARSARRSGQRDAQMSLAWHVAMLSRIEAKKFPSHDRLMQRRKSRRPMTPDEQWRMMSAIAQPTTHTRN